MCCREEQLQAVKVRNKTSPQKPSIRGGHHLWSFVDRRYKHPLMTHSEVRGHPFFFFFFFVLSSIVYFCTSLVCFFRDDVLVYSAQFVLYHSRVGILLRKMNHKPDQVWEVDDCGCPPVFNLKSTANAVYELVSENVDGQIE